MSTPELHIARAQAIHDDLARWKPALERQGCAVTLMFAPDRDIAWVILGVVMKGRLEEARQRAAVLKAMAHVQGFELSGGVSELLREDLAPDEWQIALSANVHRSRAPRRKAA